tara:strand:- start:100 stop:504 length:405 start_codon:yes stop_codon:yes gene_type:complete
MAGLFHGILIWIFTRLIFFKKVEKSIVLKNMEFIIDEGILKTEFYLPSGEVILFGIKFLDITQSIYFDVFEDHSWEWPMSMFVDCEGVLVHSKRMYIPNPSSEYLAGVFGESWQKPNTHFNYFDYNSGFKEVKK